MRRYSSNITDPFAQEYMDSFKKMSDDFGIDNDVKVSMLARCPEVPHDGGGSGGRRAYVELLKDALLKDLRGLCGVQDPWRERI